MTYDMRLPGSSCAAVWVKTLSIPGFLKLLNSGFCLILNVPTILEEIMAIPVLKVVVDVVLCLCVAIPFAVLELTANPNTPYQRGFYCNDETIRYPYKEDTISDAVLIVVGVFPNVIAMFIVEWLLYKHCNSDESNYQPVYRRKDVGSKSFHPYAIALYCTLGPFLFGMATIGLLTDGAKFLIGRLRPHFISVCDPDFSNITCFDDLGNPLYMYIQDFTCRGTDESKLTDARLSFPSGHASYSFFCMLYLAFYLQYRMVWSFSLLLKPFLQLVGLTWAFMCALSRVSDYKHHPTDVLAGSVLGALVALGVVLFVSDPIRNRLLKLAGQHRRYSRTKNHDYDHENSSAHDNKSVEPETV